MGSPLLTAMGSSIRELREQRGLSLRAMSEKLKGLTTEGISFQHLSAVERGQEWPSQELVAAIGEVLGAKERLLDSYRDARAPSNQPESAPWMRKIEALITKGRLQEARASLEQRAGQDRRAERVHALLRLGDVERMLGNVEACDARHLEAAELAQAAGLDRDVAIALDRVGTRWAEVERYEEAAALVRTWLRRQVGNSRIWRRLGIIEWYAGNFSEAYAALTTAMHLGHRRRNILHARGQVLAAWGCSEEAISDLDEVLSANDLSAKAEAAARTAREAAMESARRPRGPS